MKLVVASCLRSLRSMGIVAGKGSFVVSKIERPEQATRASPLSFDRLIYSIGIAFVKNT